MFFTGQVVSLTKRTFSRLLRHGVRGVGPILCRGPHGDGPGNNMSKSKTKIVLKGDVQIAWAWLSNIIGPAPFF